MKRLLVIMSCLALVSSSALAAGAQHEHSGHEHSGGGAGALKLNNGKKWMTDAPLRQGMEEIKKQVGAEIESIHKGKANERTYERLAKGIDEQVQFVFKNCKLPAQADAQLHLVLVRVMNGSKEMKAAKSLDERRAGAVEVVRALGQYGEYFDHPGWKPLTH